MTTITTDEGVLARIRRILSQFWKKVCSHRTHWMNSSHLPKIVTYASLSLFQRSWVDTRRELAVIPEISKVLDGWVKELLLMFSKDPLSIKDALMKLSNMFPKNKPLQEAIKEMRDFNHFAKVFGIVDMVRTNQHGLKVYSFHFLMQI